MAVGDMVVATGSIPASGADIPSFSSFKDTEGNTLSTTDAVIIRSIIVENDIEVGRVGDPDDDSVFEISIPILSQTGATEIHSETLVFTDQARLSLEDNSGVGQNYKLIGEQVDPADVFVEQQAGVSSPGSLAREIQTAGTEEYILEVAAGGAHDIQRQVDADDTGSYTDSADIVANVETGLTSGVLTELWLSNTYPSDRSNPLFRTSVVNAEGATIDMMILGTIV